MYFIIFGPLNSHCILVMMFISSIVYKKKCEVSLIFFNIIIELQLDYKIWKYCMAPKTVLTYYMDHKQPP